MYFFFPLTSFIVSTLTTSSLSTSLSPGDEEFSPTPDSSKVLQKCLQVHSVPYSNSTSQNWANLTTPFNLHLPYTPTSVTLPKTPEEVGNSVTCAAKAGMKVQPRGGGHSYASYSIGGHNGSVVVDMSGFDDIVVDRGGHATNGGYGYDSRLWGLALDTIVGLDAVLANGSFIHATETQNTKIWYALRGAADAFGIVTYFYMQTQAAPEEVTYFTVNLSSTLSSANKVSEALLKTQEFVLNNPLLTPNTSFEFNVNSGGSLAITGMCMFCNLPFFRDVVFPQLVSGFDIDSQNISNLSWIDTLATLAAPDHLAQPLQNYSLHDTFYVKSLVSKSENPSPLKPSTHFFTYILSHQSPETPYFSIINSYGAPGSAIDSGALSSSSHADMDALWVFQNYGYTPNHLPPWDPRITRVIEGMTDAVTTAQPAGNFSGYVNYVDPDLTAEEAAEEYYGARTYDRLLAIKAEVDSGFVFWNPQAIGNVGVLPVDVGEEGD
ncbi:hypothetical protein DID88_009231 [Monilinia fructigena]|uniref:FAD-binding PCMH-type domain-containing protein n=1 Tax=Monilinia fructigena TaxID=38457 RepID=A0A395IFF1_9HELO|nr:hypothetical protein DID88_009231 [Monilinia fructigena]